MIHATMKEKTFSYTIRVVNNKELSDSDRRLIEAAKKATETSYAPYSHFHVGAALSLEDGHIVTGSNQENAAYPSGLCAERTALFYAHSRYPHLAITALAIAARTDESFTDLPVSPCGACRQVLAEMQKESGRPIRVLLFGTQEIYLIKDANDLLPLTFDLTNRSKVDKKNLILFLK